MTIRIGAKEVAVPDFIANASEGNKQVFHVFLKEALTAQSEKTRNKIEMELWKKAKQEEALGKMTGGSKDPFSNLFEKLFGGNSGDKNRH